ncbi:hypothetical protein D3C72_1943330 [compost metagenome]
MISVVEMHGGIGLVSGICMQIVSLGSMPISFITKESFLSYQAILINVITIVLELKRMAMGEQSCILAEHPDRLVRTPFIPVQDIYV